VEHDEETIRRAEHVIDLGPGAGVHGGEVVASGPLDSVLEAPRSVTGRVLADPPRHPMLPRRRTVVPPAESPGRNRGPNRRPANDASNNALVFRAPRRPN